MKELTLQQLASWCGGKVAREEAAFSRNFARYINERNVIEISELFATAIRDIGQNANGKIVFFDMALKLIVLILR